MINCTVSKYYTGIKMKMDCSVKKKKQKNQPSNLQEIFEL